MPETEGGGEVSQSPAVQVCTGDLVEATTVSTTPCTVRMHLVRAPWSSSDDIRRTAITEGRGPVVVHTDTIRVLGGYS